MGRVIQGALIVAGVIHLLPVPGALGADQLTSLYGVPFQEANLVILMRHRAVLFGLLGLFLIYAAFRPAMQAAALTAGMVSVASFIGLAWSVGGYNRALARVVLADGVALVCLLVATALFASVGVRGGR